MSQQQETLLSVGGMNCAGCALGIEAILKAQPGVREAHVNFATREARILFAKELDPQALVDAIRAGGYQAEIPLDTSDDPLLVASQKAQAEAGTLFQSALFAAVIGFVLMVLTAGLMTHSHTSDPLSAWYMRAMEGFVRLLGLPLERVPQQVLEMVSILLGFVVLIGPGRGFFVQAFKSLRFGRVDMNTLVALGSLVAWLASVAGVVWPHGPLGHGKAAYFEGVAWLIAFVLLGRALEHRARGKASDAVRALLALRPDTASKVTPEGEISINLKDVRLGDTLRVLPGERVPVDGEITQGSTEIDEALLTGEPLPAVRKQGDRITAGTLNRTGSILMVARALGADSVVGRLAKLVRQAQSRRAPIEALADQISSIFVPIVLLLSLITLFGWFLFNGDWGHAIARSVAVLVVACPCALGLAMPVAVVSALGRGARLGILFKGGDGLSGTALINHIVFDKTGTLTLGKPTVVQSWLSPDAKPNTLAIAKSLASHSDHPLSKSLVESLASEKTLEVYEATNHPGQGIEGQFLGEVVRLGTARWLKSCGIVSNPGFAQAKSFEDAGMTVSLFSLGDNVLAVWGFEDTPRKEAPGAIASLRKFGLGVELLSGDQPGAVARVAQTVGIETYFGSVSPKGKLQHIANLHQRGLKVAMVGDGLNDGPALAQADVGIAMAQGADLAIEAADVTLMRPDLGLLPKGIVLARRTRSIIRQNLVWAFGYNLIAVPFAAGAFEPLIGFSPGPALAGLAMAFSSVSVVLNSLRLTRG